MPMIPGPREPRSPARLRQAGRNGLDLRRTAWPAHRRTVALLGSTVGEREGSALGVRREYRGNDTYTGQGADGGLH